MIVTNKAPYLGTERDRGESICVVEVGSGAEYEKGSGQKVH